MFQAFAFQTFTFQSILAQILMANLQAMYFPRSLLKGTLKF